LLMHRFILNVSDPEIQVDHRDRNGLDNRRANLRICSRHENMRNARRRADSLTGLKGVGLNNRINRYHARIFADGKPVYLGSFMSAEEAHAAYCRAAERLFGDFARFN
ncbi:MAG: HNH endonuclease, partial [Burkholderiales bacterium]